MQYMPQNLMKNKGIAKTDIGIKNVAYNCFVNILKKDIKYNKTFEFIFYKSIGIKQFEISTQ